MGPRVLVTRMHLHRQVPRRIDKLDQHRQAALTVRLRMRPDELRVRTKHIHELLARKCTARHPRRPIRMRRALPGLRQRRHINMFIILLAQPRTAPDIILGRRRQEERSVSISHTTKNESHAVRTALINIYQFHVWDYSNTSRVIVNRDTTTMIERFLELLHHSP